MSAKSGASRPLSADVCFILFVFVYNHQRIIGLEEITVHHSHQTTVSQLAAGGTIGALPLRSASALRSSRTHGTLGDKKKNYDGSRGKAVSFHTSVYSRISCVENAPERWFRPTFLRLYYPLPAAKKVVRSHIHFYRIINRDQCECVCDCCC